MTSINNQEKKGNGLLSGSKFAAASTPENVASPAPSNPEHMPTGYLPKQAQPAPSGNHKGSGLLSRQGGRSGASGGRGLLNGQNYGSAPQQQQGAVERSSANGGPGQRGPLNPSSHGGPGPQRAQRPPAGFQGAQGPQRPGSQGARPGGPGAQHPGPQGARPGGPQGARGGQPIPTGPTGQIVLYKGPHFYVRTTIHPNKRQSKNPLRKPTGHTTMIPKVIPEQEQRVAASETRMMPSLDISDITPRERFYIPGWLEIIIVIIGVVGSVVAHAYNMFNFPRYEMDEGTYMSAAWAVLNGKIYPYAYGYGHPPFAWMQLAALVKLVGSFFLFGNAIDTGRVLMLLYTLGSTLLIYLIVRKVTGNRSAALLTLGIFAFSPLAVTFQRLVLLDNIATFWFLLSLYFLVISKSRLQFITLSAICFGLSMLSKEVLILFMPGMVYGVWLHATKFQRKFAIVAFTYTFIAVASLFLLMATLKGELFPTGWLPWDKNQHLSLIGTFAQQTGRGQKEGSLTDSLSGWYQTDPLLVILSVVPLAFNMLVGWWKQKQLFFAILGISFWLLFIRGGVVLSFYLIPLIPLIAINTALMVNTIAEWVGDFVRLDLLRAFLVCCALGGVLFFDATHSQDVYTSNITSVQTDTMAWIRANVPRNSYIVMNAYLYMELRAPGGAAVGNGAVYPNADVYINIATDPALYNLVGGNADRVDYIIADSQVYAYIQTLKSDPNASFLYKALYHSGLDANGQPVPCAKFQYGSGLTGYEIDIYCVQHANLRPVALTTPSGVPQMFAGGTIPVDRRSLMG
jgi:Dolichyl-phosphate-mannose-protein mannosyltransferase